MTKSEEEIIGDSCTVKCPLCNEEQSDLWECGLKDNDWEDFQCMSCGGHFQIQNVTSNYYIARKNETK